uniref:Uncharacterized protein n=2 Tax=Cacopsylla melanoneura TaxID=428564 RepID=A0A8D8ZTU7_9HEMI
MGENILNLHHQIEATILKGYLQVMIKKVNRGRSPLNINTVRAVNFTSHKRIKMQRATFIVLLTVFVLAATDECDNSILEKIKNIDNVLKIYIEELETTLPKTIRTSIERLDLMSDKYDGNCKTLMNEAGNYGFQAIDNYYRAMDFLVRWSSMAKGVLGAVLPKHEQMEEDLLEKLIVQTVNMGFKALNRSLRTLDTVCAQLESMQNNLESIPEKLKNELKMLQLSHKKNISSKKRNKKRNKLITTTTEGSIPQSLEVNVEDSTPAIEEHTDSAQNQTVIIEMDKYYNLLIETVISTTNTVSKVREEFQKSFVDKVRRLVDKESNINVYSWGSKDSGISTLVLEELKNLMKTLDTYLQMK